MNKTELIAEVAKKCGISKKDAEKAVTTTFDTIADALSQGDKVQLVGFGGFETKKREARMGHRDPRYHHPRLQGRQGAEGKDRKVSTIPAGQPDGCPVFCAPITFRELFWITDHNL